MEQIKIITITLSILLLISMVSAEVISIEPETLNPLSMYSGELITQNITIKTDGNYLVYLDYNITGNTYNMVGFSTNLPQWIFIEEEEIFEIEITTDNNFRPDNFTINFNTFTTGSKIEKNSSNIYHETTEEIDTGLGLILDIKSNGEGIVEAYKVAEGLESNFGIPSLDLFFHIEASDSIINEMNETEIKVSYTDAEVNDLGIDENKLKLYFYNETLKNWEPIHSWVDPERNFVYGITNHFSLWGIFGTLISEPEIVYQYSGGGTRTIYKENKTIEYIINETTKEVCKGPLCPIEELDDEELIDTPIETDSYTWIYWGIAIILI